MPRNSGWIGKKGIYKLLISPPTRKTRSRDEQLPNIDAHRVVLDCVYAQFIDNPTSFEYCAVSIAQLILPSIIDPQVTPRTADGGRDATGIYRIGQPRSFVSIGFSLEAKFYAAANAVGVADVSGLISRLRHRQFGILVTTPYVGRQVYKEIVEDNHPIVVIGGVDIVKSLFDKIGDLKAIKSWLDEFSDPRLPAA